MQVPKDEAGQVSIGLSWSQEEVDYSVDSQPTHPQASTDSGGQEQGQEAGPPVAESSVGHRFSCNFWSHICAVSRLLWYEK